MQLTVLESSTFCVSDERGDICGGVEGLYAEDTRYLSACTAPRRERLLPLTSRLTEFFEATFVLRNPVVAGLGHDELAILRRRRVAGGSRNGSRYGTSRGASSRSRSSWSSPALPDIFTVKQNDPDLDHPRDPEPLQPRLRE